MTHLRSPIKNIDQFKWKNKLCEGNDWMYLSQGGFIVFQFDLTQWDFLSASPPPPFAGSLLSVDQQLVFTDCSICFGQITVVSISFLPCNPSCNLRADENKSPITGPSPAQMEHLFTIPCSPINPEMDNPITEHTGESWLLMCVCMCVCVCVCGHQQDQKLEACVRQCLLSSNCHWKMYITSAWWSFQQQAIFSQMVISDVIFSHL